MKEGMFKVSKDFVRFGMLYDFYGKLLTLRQAEVLGLYHNENMSLAEIADEFQISRQGVHDTLKNAEKTLQTYEEKLLLIEKSTKREKLAKAAFRKIENLSKLMEKDENFQKELKEIRSIVEKMAE